MKNFLFILAAVFALTSTQASADEGLYAGVFGGANWLNINNKRASADFDVGYVVGGSIGYRWCGGLRVEGEIAYRNNEIKKCHIKQRRNHNCNISSSSSSSSCSSSSSSFSPTVNHNDNRLKGHYQSVSYLVNALYDYPFECSPWKAYVGVGLGGITQKFNHKKHHNKCDSSSSSSSFCSSSSSSSSSSCSKSSSSDSRNNNRRPHKDENGFAAQAIVGLGYNFCDNIDFTVEYRYLYATTRHNNNNNNNAIVVGAQTGF